MILNEKVIQNKILKRTLIQQILKARSKIAQIPKYFHLIQNLSNKVQSQQVLLLKIQNDMRIKKQHLSQIKNNLIEQLQKKVQQKMQYFQIASNEMKVLNQNCSEIRNKNQIIKDLYKSQNKLKNELQELQILIEESQSEILSHQFLRIQEEKEQKDLLELMRQKQVKNDSLRIQRQKQANLQGIQSQNIIALESKMSSLDFQKSKLQISQALLLTQLQNNKSQIKKLQKEHKIQKTRLFQSKSNIRKNQQSSQDELEKTKKNKDKSQDLKDRIKKSLQEANELNDKIIKTRQFVISMNISKNQQKKANQILRLKVRQLMKTSLGINKDSPEL